MKIMCVKVGDLIPIQRWIYITKVREVMHNFDPALFEPVPVIKYKGKYLMGDGHTRSYVLAQRSNHVLVKILETDEEVTRCREGIFSTLNSIDDFIREYETDYGPRCEAEGIHSVRDYKPS